MSRDTVKALLFDVFGTVVDWRGSIVRLGSDFATQHGLGRIDWDSFARAWRAGYGPAMDRVRRGEIAWANIDALHRLILDEILADYGLSSLSDAHREEMNRFWHRLDPWPDARSGLARLKERYTIATLSNGNVALLTNMAKHAGLPWDCVLSAELFGHYKPDEEVYLGAARLLGLEPARVMMVAAHTGDLRAAAACGMRTAFVPRPEEYGDESETPMDAEPWVDVVAPDFPALAVARGA
jgi:2-haloacid dehalogenase